MGDLRDAATRHMRQERIGIWPDVLIGNLSWVIIFGSAAAGYLNSNPLWIIGLGALSIFMQVWLRPSTFRERIHAFGLIRALYPPLIPSAVLYGLGHLVRAIVSLL